MRDPSLQLVPHTRSHRPLSQNKYPSHFLSAHKLLDRLIQSLSVAQDPCGLQVPAAQYIISPGKTARAVALVAPSLQSSSLVQTSPAFAGSEGMGSGNLTSDSVQRIPQRLFAHSRSPMQAAIAYPWFSGKRQSLTLAQPPFRWHVPSDAQ